MSEIISIKFNTLRKPEFRLETRIVEESGIKYVDKILEDERALSHINSLQEKIDTISDLWNGIDILGYNEKIDGGLRFPFVEGQSLDSKINIKANKIEDVIEGLKKQVEVVLNINDKYKTTFLETEDFIEIYGHVSGLEGLDAVTVADIDSCLDNFIITDDGIKCIDCEWIMPITLPISYIEYRVVRYFYLRHNNFFNCKISKEDFLRLYGFSASDIEIYEKMETRFLYYVHGEEYKYLYITKYEKPEYMIDFSKDTSKYIELIENEDKINELKMSFKEQGNIANQLQHELDAHKIQLSQSQNELYLTRVQLEQVFNSTSWKLTKPIRKMGGVVRRHKGLLLMAKFLKLCIKQGPVVALKRVAIYVRKHKYNIEHREDVQIAEPTKIMEGERILLHVPPAVEVDGSIAIHIHLFYEDLLEEFCAYLDKMPFIYDLYVSCREGVDSAKIAKRLKCLAKVQYVDVRNVPNWGRDIAPLYVAFGKEIASHDYFLHVHSKKSLYTNSERVEWRQYSLNSLLGSDNIIRRIFTLLQEEKTGLVFPDAAESVPKEAFSWLKNRDIGAAFLAEMGIPFEDGIFMYPAGSFFWAKTDALRPIFDMNLTMDRFPEEAGQTDGTLAHVLERAIYFVAKHRGYSQYILDYKEGLARCDFSYKPFRSIMSMDEYSLCYCVQEFDVISFDIFDTLITRTVYQPDDVFHIMRKRILDLYNVDIDFLKLRKKAERDSDLKRGARTNINDIYSEMDKYLTELPFGSDELKQMEIDIELEICIPRVAMRTLYNKLKEDGKVIILVSDMYLTSDIIAQMLTKCGYDGWDRMYISNEVGLRKDADTIWDLVLSDFENKSICHIGDNVRSDWQTIVDRGKDAYWIWNSHELVDLSHAKDALGVGVDDLSMRNELGLFMNEGLFNSPFAIRDNYEVKLDNPYQMGFTVFGPVFYAFIKWLDYVTPDDAILAFLAREGYLLQKVYKAVHEEVTSEEKENCYFLASRRAVTVASVSEKSDIFEILNRRYYGGVKNLFKSRLGLDIDVEDVELGYEKLDQELIEYFDEILTDSCEQYEKQFSDEREGYLSYVDETISLDKWDKVYLVDVGYSGTIQYFMSKLLSRSVNAAYLGIYSADPLPQRRGCIMKQLYGVDSEFIKVIEQKQLFLESILSAPYGQLVSIEKTKDGVKPHYKDDSYLNEEIVKMQEGLIDYCRKCASMDFDYDKGVSDAEQSLVEYAFGELLSAEHMTDELASVFTVQDDYCSNGTLTFDSSTNKWDVVM